MWIVYSNPSNFTFSTFASLYLRWESQRETFLEEDKRNFLNEHWVSTVDDGDNDEKQFDSWGHESLQIELLNLNSSSCLVITIHNVHYYKSKQMEAEKCVIDEESCNGWLSTSET